MREKKGSGWKLNKERERGRIEAWCEKWQRSLRTKFVINFRVECQYGFSSLICWRICKNWERRKEQHALCYADHEAGWSTHNQITFVSATSRVAGYLVDGNVCSFVAYGDSIVSCSGNTCWYFHCLRFAYVNSISICTINSDSDTREVHSWQSIIVSFIFKLWAFLVMIIALIPMWNLIH